ncbi:calcium sensing receptor [Dunaliella salina]|uniref:Calcium sensing receptor n=1 Tax=Dunaliella salina TaxID=3046 RepID=A0ABQ7GED8_DUNSA|nr:calcium sensing receptor [Dunaliella salina]|eukprot:KAF5832972.1 calcium sensing receptor [Dunaliella salina]
MMLGRQSVPARRACVSCKAGGSNVPRVVKPKLAGTKQMEQASLLVTANALLAAVPPALAEEGEKAVAAAPAPVQGSTFDSAVDSLINAVQASGSVIKNVDDAVLTAYGALQQGYGVAAPVINDAVKTATPVVQQAWNTTSGVAGPALKSFLPSFQSAEKALESQIPKGLPETATEAYSSASPFLTKFVQFVSSKDPLTLAEYTLAVVVFFVVAPALLGAFRGYSDDVPPAAALNTLVNDGDAVMVDIRTPKEKELSGVPDLPSAASSKAIEVEFAVTEDKKLRDQLRNVKNIESQITALQIAALKKVSKGTKVLLLDKNGSAAKDVAKELARKGFGNVFVINGGFDGRNGWIQSKLQIKPAASLLTSSFRRSGSGSTRAKPQLPAPKS